MGDVSGDGRLDLIVADYSFVGTVSVLLGNGDGSFQTARSFAAGNSPNSVAVGDVNGDSFLDLAVANGFNDAAQLKKDDDLKLLRDREAFRQLLADLEAKSKPVQ